MKIVQVGTPIPIYNAGTDIFTNDALGGFDVSEAGVLERDKFVLDQLAHRRLPTAIVLSGGYSRESYRLVGNMVQYALQRSLS